jgi:2-polyprenyl-3-methyl-5-hydroxy-6-metoxy-1,4-benzoquinol methylase
MSKKWFQSIKPWVKAKIGRPPAWIYYNLFFTPLQTQYRKNVQLIEGGDVPERYKTLAKHVPGKSIVEIGAGECILSLYLASQGKEVWAVDLSRKRTKEGERIKKIWQEQGKPVEQCRIERGGTDKVIELLENADTLVAIHVMYHLEAKAVPFVKSIPANVKFIVMAGNRMRASQWQQNKGADDSMGKWNYYASIEGMKELVLEAGFEPSVIDSGGSPIVIGERRGTESSAQ